MRMNHKLLGFLAGGAMLGLLAMSGTAGAQPIPDSFFATLGTPWFTPLTTKVTVIKGKGTEPDDTIKIQGTFTNYVPLVHGVNCNSVEANDDNFLNNSGAMFYIGVGPGGITQVPVDTLGPGMCIPANPSTGIEFEFVWQKKSGSSTVAIPLGTATWGDSDSNSGTSAVTGTMTLIAGNPTGSTQPLNDCGTWVLNVSFPNVNAASIGYTNGTPVNIQMDFGNNNGTDVNFSAACAVLPLSASSCSSGSNCSGS